MIFDLCRVTSLISVFCAICGVPFHLDACFFGGVFFCARLLRRFFSKFCRSHKNITMVKAVVVLNSSEGVSGTVQFNQEGDGMIVFIETVAISLYFWILSDC